MYIRVHCCRRCRRRCPGAIVKRFQHNADGGGALEIFIIIIIQQFYVMLLTINMEWIALLCQKLWNSLLFQNQSEDLPVFKFLATQL